MTTAPTKTFQVFPPDEWAPSLLIALAWIAVTALGVKFLGRDLGIPFAVAAAIALSLTLALNLRERRRLGHHREKVNNYLAALGSDPTGEVKLIEAPEFLELNSALRCVTSAIKRKNAAAPKPGNVAIPRPCGLGKPAQTPMTRSGLFESPSGVFEVPESPSGSADFSTSDMVNRLDPKLFRWLESSPGEQLFLGWNLRQLREMSFFEIVHPDDLERAKAQLRTALVKGEVHGLILRIRTAFGKPKAIEMNIGARYDSEMAVSHIRCHVTDVTQKIRSERELRLRTRELTQVNDQLRLINRELEELKERYRDLYQNAPAMYFSIDEEHRLVDCNDTLLETLGYRRDRLVGQPYVQLLPEHKRPLFPIRFEEFLRVGAIEVESQWVKANGDVIDVWLTASIVRDAEGRIIHSRSVAQDITARHRLEAELKEKNQRLARTNEELSRKNREMDEFTHVVSHDLQEPLRTLIAFSGFLLQDYGHRLDAEGQEFVRHIVEASRRMRSLIQDLLTLSRSGKVTGEFEVVNLDEVLSVVRSDLAELIRTKGAEVKVIDPLPEVWGDRDRIGQLLSNLIVNGLKYNDKPHPLVEIGCLHEDPSCMASATTNESATIYVKDNGIGIEPKFHSKIFQLFRRLHTRDEYEGTGAGLAICTKIVQAHLGKIWVESHPSEGSTFFVTIRRRRSPSEVSDRDDHQAVIQPQGSHDT
jgi:PAS domain S-box-containing protein